VAVQVAELGRTGTTIADSISCAASNQLMSASLMDKLRAMSLSSGM